MIAPEEVDQGRCCARCKTPYGCANSPCACHRKDGAA